MILLVSKYRLAHIRATKTDYVVIFAGLVDEESDHANKIKTKIFLPLKKYYQTLCSFKELIEKITKPVQISPNVMLCVVVKGSW